MIADRHSNSTPGIVVMRSARHGGTPKQKTKSSRRNSSELARGAATPNSRNRPTRVPTFSRETAINRWRTFVERGSAWNATATPPTTRYLVPTLSKAANRAVQSPSPGSRSDHLVIQSAEGEDLGDLLPRGGRCPVTIPLRDGLASARNHFAGFAGLSRPSSQWSPAETALLILMGRQFRLLRL